jgi:hypothetical protein
MSANKGELAKTSSSEISSFSNSSPNQIPVLAKVEERLANATTPEEIVLWTRVRAEILKQNELAEEGKHRRTLEKVEVASQKAVTAAALGIGVGLIIIGVPEIGLFVLGAGLFKLAPDYVKKVFATKN